MDNEIGEICIKVENEEDLNENNLHSEINLKHEIFDDNYIVVPNIQYNNDPLIQTNIEVLQSNNTEFSSSEVTTNMKSPSLDFNNRPKGIYLRKFSCLQQNTT